MCTQWPALSQCRNSRHWGSMDLRITCRLDFHTEIEWNENRKMLKVGGGA